MSRALRDYNSINWNDLFCFDPNSPTGLSWKVDQELNVKNSPKRKDNNTGESGVHFTIAKGRKVDSYTYATATWYPESNKRACEHFSVNSMGLMPAFKAAVEHRRKMIEELNAQGAGYTENHGK